MFITSPGTQADQSIVEFNDILLALLADDLPLFQNRCERLLLLIKAEVDANDINGSQTIPVLISLNYIDCESACLSDLDFKKSMLVLASQTNSLII